MKGKTRVNFTIQKVEAGFKYTGNGKLPTFYWDETPGLGLKIMPSGKRLFIFQQRGAAGLVRRVLGEVTKYRPGEKRDSKNEWTLDRARAEARRLSNEVHGGVKPPTLMEKAADAQAEIEAKEREGITVQKIWDRYLEHHKEYWSERHYNDHVYLSTKSKKTKKVGVLVPLLKMHAADMSAAALIRWSEKAKKTKQISPQNKGRHTDVVKGFIRFRAFWRWAHGRPEEFGDLASPTIFNNSDFRKTIPESRVRSDVLQKSQLEAWFGAVRKLSNPVIAAYLQALLITGARRNELGELKWSDVDTTWKSMHIKDKIKEEGRTIPLTPYVEQLISTLPKRNEWVFSTAFRTSTTGRLAEPRIAHRRALETAGLPRDLTLHGLRRSMISLSEWIEAPSGVIAQICGHAPSAVQERHYKARSLDLLAVWHNKLEAWLLETAKVPFDRTAATSGLHVIKTADNAGQ